MKHSLTALFKNALVLTLVPSALALTACQSETTTDEPITKGQVVANTGIAKATPSTNNVDWAKHGNSDAEERYSQLKHINSENVSSLGLSWYFDLPGESGQEATPLVVDGVMYTTSAWSHVFALNPVTGEKLWHFDPKVDKAVAVKGCCGPVNRGLAYSNGKVFIGAFDGRLIAIDAKTGKPAWEVQTVDTSKNYTVTGAPRVAKGKVFIGNGGAEYGVRGYVSAYDENSGELAWRFYTTPGDPSKPQENEIHNETVKTWSGDFWKLGGGATAWDSMAFDADLNLLYVGTGNSSPWNPRVRTNGEGDNLFVSSILALNPDTGKYVWHYQTTPQDGWDYTATQHMILTDLVIDGENRKVIMQAPKNGFFYVLDRVNGEYISADNFVPVTWATGIDDNGRPIINPEAKYWEQDKPVLVTPAWTGGHNWHPMSYSKKTGLVYIPAHEMSFPYFDDPNFDINSPLNLAVNLGVNVAPASFPDDPEIIKVIKSGTKGHLSAWDPVAQKEVWRVQYAGPWNGGVLSTAGDLIFQGSAAGFVNAYRSTTGEKLWEFAAQSGVVAPPISYQIDGEQYISVSVGWGGIFPRMTGPLTQISHQDPVNRSRIMTFKLNANKELPEIETALRTMQKLDSIEYDAVTAKSGHANYERYCAGCHGTGAVGGGVVPDLRFSPSIATSQGFQSIVSDGALASRGMVGFSDELSVDEVEALRQFVIGRNKFAHSIGDIQRTSR